MREHPDFLWHYESDQPRTIRNRKLKRMMYLRSVWQYLKSGLCFLLLPGLLIAHLMRRRSVSREVGSCIGLAVHVELPCEEKTIIPIDEVAEMVRDLGVRHVLVRVLLADSDRLDTYVNHIKALRETGCEVVVNIVQSKYLTDDRDKLHEVLDEVVAAISGEVSIIQVGNAYNRRKWGFAHFGEYYGFFKAVRKSCDKLAPEMKLLGGSVIDFEMPPYLESMFHLRSGRYDGYASQLYVDRRGAPENQQMGFNWLNKINFLDLMTRWSWKVKGELWITEFNWPLKSGGKFVPCYGSVLVEEDRHANYMSRSYLIAMASGRVRTCYWHQLVAPGYGFVDNRQVPARKLPIYDAFKTLNTLCNDGVVTESHLGDYQGVENAYCVTFESHYEGRKVILYALWANDCELAIESPDVNVWLDQNGDIVEPSKDKECILSGRVVFGISYQE